MGENIGIYFPIEEFVIIQIFGILFCVVDKLKSFFFFFFFALGIREVVPALLISVSSGRSRLRKDDLLSAYNHSENKNNNNSINNKTNRTGETGCLPL